MDISNGSLGFGIDGKVSTQIVFTLHQQLFVFFKSYKIPTPTQGPI
jgi:hypothetical protein